MFGSAGLFCYDAGGKELWRLPMGPFKTEFGAGSSPLLLDGRLILNEDVDSASFLTVLDVRTGKPLWRIDRSEFLVGYASPVLWEVGGKRQIVQAGTLRVVGYDLETGREIWTVRGMARRDEHDANGRPGQRALRRRLGQGCRCHGQDRGARLCRCAGKIRSQQERYAGGRRDPGRPLQGPLRPVRPRQGRPFHEGGVGPSKGNVRRRGQPAGGHQAGRHRRHHALARPLGSEQTDADDRLAAVLQGAGLPGQGRRLPLHARRENRTGGRSTTVSRARRTTMPRRSEPTARSTCWGRAAM